VLGLGIIKGMVVTARNFVGSYHDPDRLPTIEYPEKRQKLPENSRSFPMLIFDGEDPEAGLRCVACKICEKECPPQCIYIVAERDSRGKAVRHPKIFDLDISVCMACQICVEVCPFDSIKMDMAFEMAGRDRFGAMLLHKSELAKSDAYFHSIHPSEAVGSDARVEHIKKPAGRSQAAPAEATRKAA